MNLSVIASYPQKSQTHGDGVVGVASYTKSLLTALKSYNKEVKITVFAEQLNNNKSYSENGIKILRSWRRNKPLSILRAIWSIKKSAPDTILISFEINMFGNAISTVIALLGIAILRLSGQKTNTIMHQVVKDFTPIEKNIIMREMLNFSKNIFYNLVSIGSTQIIVFEQALKDFLGKRIGIKTTVIPHAIFNQKVISKKSSRIKLGLSRSKKYALYFGFIAPYKGVDKLVSAWIPSKNTELIIAGGANPNHSKNKKIQNYVSNVSKEASKKGIIVTEFLPEELIPLYFSAADVVILPYETFMSSSGPLALAISYQKPFILSPALRPYSLTNDINTALKNSSLSVDDIICKIKPSDLKKKIIWGIKNSERFHLFSSNIKSARSFTNISKNYYQLIK